MIAPTSIAAAQSIAPHARTLREKLYTYLLSQGIHGATDEQCQDALKMSASTERPRRLELKEAGRVCQSGEIRATKSGRCAIVWIAVSK